MYKLLALYDHPEDVEAFEAHYRDVHAPLAEKVPGLERLVVNRVKGDPMGGEPRYYQISEMQFSDAETFKQASQSDEFKATGEDLANFAKGKVTLLIVES